jgi:hypothetical protein
MVKLGPKQSSVIRDPSAPRAGGLQSERRAHAVDSALISYKLRCCDCFARSREGLITLNGDVK